MKMVCEYGYLCTKVLSPHVSKYYSPSRLQPKMCWYTELHGTFFTYTPWTALLPNPMGPIFVIQTVQFVNSTNKLQDVEADYPKSP